MNSTNESKKRPIDEEQVVMLGASSEDKLVLSSQEALAVEGSTVGARRGTMCRK